MEPKNVKILEETWMYQGFVSIKRYLLQHELFKGGWSPAIMREVSIRPRAAAVLPYDPLTDQVVLIEQFRPGALSDPEGPWMIEIVAGLLEAGETPEDLARREAQEEAGVTLLALEQICEYWSSPGGSNEYLTLFCGQVDASQVGGVYGVAEEHEDIRVFALAFEEAFQWAAHGKIKNPTCLLALFWLKINKEKLHRRWA
ncbi:MAG: NUDIX domain-containing protein [Gammaproteobacteria bacterium]